MMKVEPMRWPDGFNCDAAGVWRHTSGNGNGCASRSCASLKLRTLMDRTTAGYYNGTTSVRELTGKLRSLGFSCMKAGAPFAWLSKTSGSAAMQTNTPRIRYGCFFPARNG
jgi:hypothetical protein